MIKPSDFVKFLGEHDINFFAGVPDSLMKNFCNYLSKILTKIILLRLMRDQP